jgi:hypothetical protein
MPYGLIIFPKGGMIFPGMGRISVVISAYLTDLYVFMSMALKLKSIG